MKLKSIKYRWRTKIDDCCTQLGLGAQTTEQALIEAGLSLEEFAGLQHDYYDQPTELGYYDRYSLCYQQVETLTMMVTQENAREIESLKVENEELRAENVELRADIEAIKQALGIA